MLVCLCKSVSDSKIRFLVQNGARSVREVVATCHAGKDCGSCVGDVKALVEKTCQEMEEGDESACCARTAANE
jgi:bacterioferritin-associated ferredoxin